MLSLETEALAIFNLSLDKVNNSASSLTRVACGPLCIFATFLQQMALFKNKTEKFQCKTASEVCDRENILAKNKNVWIQYIVNQCTAVAF